MTDDRDGVALIPCKRFEWERIIRRTRLAHKDVAHLLADPDGRKISGAVVKAVALTLASYASSDGTRARPGERRLAASVESTAFTVRTALAVLEDVGLITKVAGGRGGSRDAAEWRLVRPDDLDDVVKMTGPDEQTQPHETSGRTTLANRSTGAVANRTSGAVDDDADDAPNRSPREPQPLDSHAQPLDTSVPTARLDRTQEQDQPETRTETAADPVTNVTHLRADARTHAREAAAAARAARTTR